MKKRLGFVSNSSSCSFLCNVCGKQFEAYDWEDDPTCPFCNHHISEGTEHGLAGYICEKFGIDYHVQMRAYQEYVNEAKKWVCE